MAYNNIGLSKLLPLFKEYGMEIILRMEDSQCVRRLSWGKDSLAAEVVSLLLML